MSDTKLTVGSLLRWFWANYLRRQSGSLLGAALLMVIEGSMVGVLSLVMKPMFDNVLVAGESSALWSVGIAIFVIFTVRAVTSVAQKVVMKSVIEKISGWMRGDLLAHLMRLDMSFHQSNPPGSLIERVQGDVANIGTVWTNIITNVVRDGVSVIWLFGVALSLDWKWTLAALIGLPVLVLPSLAVQGYIRRKTQAARELATKMSTQLDEVFHGINPIKLNTLEDYQQGRYTKLTKGRVRAEVKATFGMAMIPGIIDLMTGVGFFVVLMYGGSQIIAGDKTVGEFMAFFTAMALVFDPLRRLGQLSGAVQSAAVSANRVREILNITPAISSPATVAAAPVGAPEIRLNDVHLAYGDLPVLQGATFTAAAGKTTALVGSSGAGKSTVFNVLTRLVDPASGLVTIGGVDNRAMGLADLRGLFSVVSQDAALFDETLRDNILLGRDLDEASIERALTAAHVSDFLPRLSDGLNSPAGPRGSNLSGGQRQRVAIARALVRNTPILLLDEATSALDTKSEQIVQSALETLSEGRTTLVIAHRLSTVRNADSIVVMDRGRVMDQGTHDELLARGGIYADLYRLQFKTED